MKTENCIFKEILIKSFLSGSECGKEKERLNKEINDLKNKIEKEEKEIIEEKIKENRKGTNSTFSYLKSIYINNGLVIKSMLVVFPLLSFISLLLNMSFLDLSLLNLNGYNLFLLKLFVLFSIFSFMIITPELIFKRENIKSMLSYNNIKKDAKIINKINNKCSKEKLKINDLLKEKKKNDEKIDKIINDIIYGLNIKNLSYKKLSNKIKLGLLDVYLDRDELEEKLCSIEGVYFKSRKYLTFYSGKKIPALDLLFFMSLENN